MQDHVQAFLQNAQALLFDLDGTLVETAPDLADTVNHVLTTHTDFAPLPEAQLRTYIGGGLTLMFEKALTFYQQPHDRVHELVLIGMEAYPHYNGKRSFLYDEMRPALELLRQHGYKLAVVTNKSAEFTEPLLRHLNIWSLFDCVVSGNTLPKKKPEPDQLYFACQQMDVAPDRTIMVGDSRFDINAAHAAGCLAVCVDYGYTEQPAATLGADLLISSVNDFVHNHLIKGS